MKKITILALVATFAFVTGVAPVSAAPVSSTPQPAAYKMGGTCCR